MEQSVCIKFDRRPKEHGIIWAQDFSARSYPGKLLPGHVVSARCCGMIVYLEILDVAYERNIKARIIELGDEGEEPVVMKLFEAAQILRLSRDNVFSCEPPSGKQTDKEKRATVVIKTECLKIFSGN